MVVKNDVEISKKLYAEDDNDGFKQFISSKYFINDDDMSDIISQYKGKALSVAILRGTDSDSLIASILNLDIKDWELIILEVPEDFSLAQIEKFMQFITKISASNASFITGIDNRSANAITCNCIKTECV